MILAQKKKPYKTIIFSIFCLTIFILGTFTALCGGTKPALGKIDSYLDDLSRGPDTPPYLSLHYRLRYLQFKAEPLLLSAHPIVFLGDSMTDNGNWNELFPKENLVNRGIGGDTTLGIIRRLDQVIALHPPKIFLMVGTNDLCYDRSIPDTLTNYDYIISRLRTDLPQTEIYIESVLPFNDTIFPSRALRTNENILELNEGIQELAEKHDLPYLDITEPFTDENGRLHKSLTVDGLHLNQKGYQIWHDLIYDEVKS